MKNSSLALEPPPKYDGKKEVKRKNRILNSLVGSLKNEKNRNKTENSIKNLEEKTENREQTYSFDIDYTKNQENFIGENFTAIKGSLEFTKKSASYPNSSLLNLHYGQMTNDVEFKGKNLPGFYDIGSLYSFTPSIKEKTKEESSYQSEEHEEKEVQYILYNFGEETTEESLK